MDQDVSPHPDLELDEDIDHERRQWKARRATSLIAGVLLILALAGSFGTGPLSWSRASGPAGLLEVDYDRFLRHTGKTELLLRVAAAAAGPDGFEVAVDSGYLDRFQVESITPEPDSVEMHHGAVVYTFASGDPAADLEVSIHLRPEGLWRQRARITVPRDSVAFWQFTFP